jgi:hypothetical protein
MSGASCEAAADKTLGRSDKGAEPQVLNPQDRALRATLAGGERSLHSLEAQYPAGGVRGFDQARGPHAKRLRTAPSGSGKR